ncbi:MAG: hypothetical protein F6K14_17000 [Symploca sp. SIO2C1]|nr:hypothetical protein [Symploca sp. SIO2C1]
MVSKGVVYVATGKQYIDEASISASSLKQKMPDLHVTLFSDQKVQASYFDECVVIKSYGHGILDKNIGMSQSPYDYTVFLDTDTYICEDFSELFTLLEKYDIGAILNETRTYTFAGDSWDYQKIKDTHQNWIYPMYNTGVILFKKTPETTQFFSDWLVSTKQWAEKHGKTSDQTTFQNLLYQSDLKKVTLPPEYNCRFVFPVGVCGTVKLLHGRHPNFPELAQEINSELGPRLFMPRWGLIPDTKSKFVKKLLKRKFRSIMSNIRLNR